MENPSFIAVSGVIKEIHHIPDNCCTTNLTLHTDAGIVNLLITSDTYVINQVPFEVGMHIIGFYDSMRPVPLIYPPQFTAVIAGRKHSEEDIAVDFFDETLTGHQISLKLNIAETTKIISTNGQPYPCNIEHKFLIVFYSFTTRSIPAQTTPRKIIVLC